MHVFCQVSNVMGFLPVAYCLQNGAHLLAAVLATAFSLSIVYHLQQLPPHANSQALFKPAGTAGFVCLCNVTVTIPCLANHINLLHPLNGSPEEGSAGVAAVTSKVEMVWSRGRTDITVQGQGCGCSSFPFFLFINRLFLNLHLFINTFCFSIIWSH